jgi:hypothetical protein
MLPGTRSRPLGLRLPADYKQFVARFPQGQFQTFLTVVQPEKDERPPTLVDKMMGLLRGMRMWLPAAPEFTDPLHPDSGGLLPWGYVGFDWVLAWLTLDQDPDRWPTLLVTPQLDEQHRFRGSMTDCLLDITVHGDALPALRYVTEECQPPRFDPLIED